MPRSTPPLAARPVLSGRTGIQRRARSTAPGRATAAPTASTGLAGIAGTAEPRAAGPRRVQVPQRVTRALLATGVQPPSHVTVHEGGTAAEQADAVNAEAFTRDGQVYLAADAPLSSERGQQLLAHELTHVIQQGSRGSTMPGEHTHEGKSLEESALAVEQAMITGRHDTVAPVVTPRPPRETSEPELHHRPVAPAPSTPSSGTHVAAGHASPSRGSSASATAPVQYHVDTSVQRRERDLSTSALSSGLGGVGRSAMGGLQDALLSQFEQEMSGPSGPKKDKDSRFKQLERQAAQLYPYIRARLRAELIREMERRGRITQEWR